MLVLSAFQQRDRSWGTQGEIKPLRECGEEGFTLTVCMQSMLL